MSILGSLLTLGGSIGRALILRGQRAHGLLINARTHARAEAQAVDTVVEVWGAAAKSPPTTLAAKSAKTPALMSAPQPAGATAARGPIAPGAALSLPQASSTKAWPVWSAAVSSAQNRGAHSRPEPTSTSAPMQPASAHDGDTQQVP